MESEDAHRNRLLSLRSLFEGVLQLKKLDRRLSHTLTSHLAYAAAIYNICIHWNGKVLLSLVDFAS
jgi:hypothetical protein